MGEQDQDLRERRGELELGRKAKTWSKSRRETRRAAFFPNRNRSQSGDELAQDDPRGRGVAEGVGRHWVKHRRKGAGMSGRLTGTRAMLKTRARYLNGEGGSSSNAGFPKNNTIALKPPDKPWREGSGDRSRRIGQRAKGGAVLAKEPAEGGIPPYDLK